MCRKLVGLNQGRIFARLKPRDQRKLSADRIIEELRPKLAKVVGMRVFEGLTNDEIASKLNCSRRSVVSYWNFARRWLEKEWVGNAT